MEVFMRIINAIRADIRFQFKQGFHTVYIFVTLFYIIVLHNLSDKAVSIALPLIVFTDPSVVGFFFIGAIVMLEKTQGVLQALITTPLRSREYLLAKAISLAILAISVSLVITLFSSRQDVCWLLLIPSILITSVFFTLYGFLAAAGCKTMNQYLARMVPYLLLIVLPCFSMLLPAYRFLFDIFPGVAALKLVYGAFHPLPWQESLFCLVYLIVWDVWMLFAVDRVFLKRIVYEEG